MRIVTSGIILTIIGLALTGCVSCQTKPFPLGNYRYNEYDKNGAKIIEGTISITSRESNHISGEWERKRISDAENNSSQIAKGMFKGEIEQYNVTIDLYPNNRDANIGLAGKIEGTRFHGVWSLSSIAGEADRGTFEAIKE